MASAKVTISMLDMEPVQRILFASNDLLSAARMFDDPALTYAVEQFEEALDAIWPGEDEGQAA